MIRKLFLTILVLLFGFWLTPHNYIYSISPDENKSYYITKESDEAPPPLGPSCSGGGTPTNVDIIACCVSGYVYVNGLPVEGADITIEAPNGEKGTGKTNIPSDSTQPNFSHILHQEELFIKPGDPVTITASYGNETKTSKFFAKEGTIQIDLVMSHTRTDSGWVNAYLFARHNHAMVYDASTQQTVLFGGYNATGDYLGDTWIRGSDGRWVQRMPSNSPSPRHGHILIYHDTYQQVLLFGGQDGEDSYLNDLWSWNGATWTELKPIDPRTKELQTDHIPTGRTNHSMTYDLNKEKAILFGGQNGSDTLGDTWVLTWTHASKMSWIEIDSGAQGNLSPPKRQLHTMTYDKARQEVLLFGGRSGIEETTPVLDDSWIWDGSQWLQKSPTQKPPALAAHSMIYVAGSSVEQNRILLFGGNNNDGSFQNDLWLWDGSRWSSQAIDDSVPTPRIRSHHAAVYDTAQNQVVLFGGMYRSGIQGIRDIADTWHWQMATSTWEQVDTPPIFTLWQGIAMAREKEDKFLIFGGLAGSSNLQAKTYRWQSTNWEELTPNHVPPARYNHGLARADSPDIQVLLFGGIGEGGESLDDTWLWNGQDWIEQTPAQRPLARGYHALIYDNEQEEWLLFGGLDDAGEIHNDLWAYNGTDWVQKTPTSTQLPEARMSTGFVYDSDRNEALLFGGQDLSNTYFNDLWVWNGDSWQEKAADEQPGPRAGHGATYDPIRQRMIISGGRDATARLEDTWTWDGSTWRKRHDDPKLPTTYVLSLEYDPIHNHLVGMGEQVGGNKLGEGLLIHQIKFRPIATISYVNPRDVPQNEIIEFEGRGADTNRSGKIINYRWTHNGTVISEEESFMVSANIFSPGFQTIRYDVQDDEGNWSEKLTELIFIREADSSQMVYLPTIMR